MDEKRTKWNINVTVEAGKESVIIANTYKTDLETRFETDELKQHGANVAELEARRSGQQQNLSNQKSETEKQAGVIAQVNGAVVKIRTMVTSCEPPAEVAEAFGLGVHISQTVGGVTTAANLILDGCKKYPAWSKKAGIIDADITKLTGLVASLNTVERVQDDSMFTRKAKTMSKNELQREVEREVTRISAIGAYIFHDKDAGVTRLFENLIPSTEKETPKKKKEVAAKINGTETADKAE